MRLKLELSWSRPVRRENDSGDVALSAGQGLPRRARVRRQRRSRRLRSVGVEGQRPACRRDRRTQVDLQSRARLARGRSRCRFFEVWLAARLSSRGKGRESDARFRKLCRRLGFGLLGVSTNGEVELLLSPNAPTPRKNSRRRSRLVEEHRRRRGSQDPDYDGVTAACPRLRRRIMTSAFPSTGLELRSTITSAGELELSLVNVPAPSPSPRKSSCASIRATSASSSDPSISPPPSHPFTAGCRW